MNSPNKDGSTLHTSSASADDVGGLHAPPELHGLDKAWWWFHFLVLVNLARLRFIAILIVIGAVIMKWDVLTAYYEKWTRPTNITETAESNVEYFCPMHPSIVRDHPDKCPICFMPLSKRQKGGSLEPLPAGTVSRVQLSPYRIVLAGIQTWKVDYLPLTKDISAVGFVEFNERDQRTVSARVAGRIDKLFVNQTGQMVTAGDELASLYSPDLLVTVQNLLDAKRAGNESFMESARTRLELLGIDRQQIDEIVASGKANTHLKIRSPISGHVINKYIREGQYVQEGTPLYDVADLSTVWIQGQVYEDDIPFLPPSNHDGDIDQDGLDVTATTRAFPDVVFHGKLTFVYPHVDEQTRTVTVRFELDNPNHTLRPGSTATVTLKVDPEKLKLFARNEESREQTPSKDGQVLALPESAIIDTGKQKIAYRETTPGVYEGVDVKIGPRMTGKDGGTYYPILAGLKSGDLIVTAGSFLVDAETRLNPALGSVYFGGSGGSQAKSTNVSNVRPSTPEDPDAKINAALAALSVEDRKLVKLQRFCPILTKNRLGSMGPPVKLVIEGQTVFLCCPGCKEKALANPKQTLEKVAELKGQSSPEAAALPRSIDGQKRYEVVGKITSIGDDQKTVTIDHEAIEGLMPAMEMPYKIERSEVIAGLNPGDRVLGKLEVRGSDYIITELQKR